MNVKKQKRKPVRPRVPPTEEEDLSEWRLEYSWN
jgi:hypothetical protein